MQTCTRILLRIARPLAIACVAALAGSDAGQAWAATTPLPAAPSVATSAEKPEPRHATRAISLAPHITELIFAAGAGQHIVATVISSDYPAAAAGIPKIGDGLNINVEKALTLNPDLVAAWQASGAARTLAPSLAKLHIPLIYSAPQTLQDIPAQVLRLGRIFGTEASAEPAAAALAQRIDTLRRRYAGKRPVTVFIEVGAAPLYTIGRDPLLNDVLETCGGVNLFADSAIAAPQVSAETLMLRQPDAIVTAESTETGFEQRVQAWTRLQLGAALKHRIYALDPDQLFRPGPRLIDAAEQLCKDLDQARN
ncbi:cobalamin-binding protein [Eoetvoesiella caeni]|uniref:Iron complex transport system substrate-binding protein/vitamin B12 transport system substrate-binding protein n=1 Tax=Eoetvoesiella caeni TaxID=645616 RepID=A0A366H8K6_9BURK|nr:cobalamin-binding protein [Eoetvoesiella caeni]MCI2809725.1 cobalamin-binding protein [Eoetvoesiella caeni]NYT56358.1 cobalamin-binding protein [Eoetvoesiella caeni]RBP38417.1 iron complex transport system substrate-binding protein/vitamin B12 transport system substrate-binding protein [Eoetvoesiella caeni]